MAQRDPNSFTPKEKYLIRKHRQSVAKFERTYGPASTILGKSFPSKFKVTAENNPSSSGLSLSVAPNVENTLATSPLRVQKVVDHGKSNQKQERLSQAPSCSRKCPPKEAPKRARSGDDVTSNVAKKVKKSGSINSQFQVAIIDRNDPDGRISVEMWHDVEGKLLDEIAAFKGGAKGISFGGADWSKGVKIVNCGNKDSLEFLKTAIGKCGTICPKAKLEVICSSELPIRPVLTVWIPPPLKPVETILTILSNQNDNLNTSQWKLINSMACKENKGRDFRFAMDKESLKSLVKVRGVVNFGLGSVRFRIPKSDRNKEVESGADKSASL